MHFPHSEKPKIEERFIQNIDFFPTIKSILKSRTKINFDGLDYFGKQPREYCYAQFANSPNSLPILKKKFKGGRFDHLIPKIYSVRDKKYKYINYENGKEELFDLTDDPLENKNLINKQKSIAEKLKKQYELNVSEKEENKNSCQLTKNSINALRGLGYF